MRTFLSLGLCLALLLGCSREQESAPTEPSAVTAKSTNAAAKPVTELQRIDLFVAPGEGISLGQQAAVHYTGWLYDPGAPEFKGKQFDSSRVRGAPFRFTVGQSKVIKGWHDGVQGMRIGSQRRLIIPPTLAYGEKGAGNGVIPPNATLIFDIELLAIEEPSESDAS